MAFWGIEVKPVKPYTHSYDSARGRLRITQAVLGNGKSDERSTLQCNVGNKSPILLCILKPDICESFHLELEFEENEQVVFSVLGKRSINLSGYFLGSSRDTRNTGDSDTESYGEDIDHSESDDDIFANLSEDDEYESDFIDDDDNIGMLSPSPRRKSGVVIEEIVEDEKPANGNANRRRLKKKNQISDSDDNEAQRQIVVKADHSAVFESEDEDGFPIALARNKDAKNAVENARSNDKSVDEDRKRKVSDISPDDPEPARETCQPLDSSTQAEPVDVNSEKPKKKKRVKDTPDQNQALGEKEISQPGKANEIEISQPGKASEIGVEVDDGPENIGKSKKKKEKAKKGKTSEAGVHSEEKTGEEPKATPNGEKTGEEPKATPNGALNIDTELDADQIMENIGKLKKSIKKKKLKDETLQDKNDVSTSEENQQIKVVDSQNMDVDKLDLELPKDESPKQDSKKKNKKKKKKKNKDANTIEQSVDTAVAEGMDDEKDGARPAKPRTFSNGLTIEELSMGKPDGERAAPGRKVKVHYTGKLRNGKVFDSTKRTPFGFRLGIGEVIKGWDVGVNGMRVGDKRRLTIPPAMGYGTKAVGAIPANSWLLFDVELVDVK